jgi:putative salt-induced outer membrane protein YdiY
MKKVILGTILFVLLPTAFAAGKVTVGGQMVKDTNTGVTTVVEHSKEYGSWQHVLEANYIYLYNEKNNTRARNEGYFSFKENYALDERSYAIGWLRYDYDELRNDSNRTSINIGYGYKLLKTDRTKISNEFSVGQMSHNLGWSDVITNSLWVSYKIDKRVTFVNRFLIDWADQQYVRNRTELNYQLDEGIMLGVANLYTKDPVDDNITTFNVGTTF